MTENTQELLAKAENAILIKDRRTACLLLHQALLQDFTNPRAWVLLHSLRGDKQPLKEFQETFARQYYPQLVYLLQPQPRPGIAASGTAAPDVNSRPVVSPFTENRMPDKPRRCPYCPTCKKIFPPEVLFCDTCGAPLFRLVDSMPCEPDNPVARSAAYTPEPPLVEYIAAPPAQLSDTQPAEVTPISTPVAQPPAGKGTLLIHRKKSPILEDLPFVIGIDGLQQGVIRNGQKQLFTLPAGTHTVEVKTEDRISTPVTIYIHPEGMVQMVSHPEGTSPELIKPELKLLQPQGAQRTKPGSPPLTLAMKIILFGLLLILFVVGIVVIAFFVVNLGLL